MDQQEPSSNTAENPDSERSSTAERLETEYHEGENSLSLVFLAIEFKKWMILGISHFFMFLLLVLWQHELVPLQASLSPLLLSNSLTILSNFRSINRCEPYQRRVFFKEILESFGIFLSEFFIILYLSLNNFRAIYIPIPLFLTTSGNICIKSISFNKCQTLSEIFFILLRISRLLASISLSLQLDSVYSISLSLALWPIWSLLGIFAIFTIGITLFTITTLCANRSALSQNDLLSSLWLTFMCIGSLLSYTIFINSLVSMHPNFYPPLIFLSSFLIVTTLCYKNLQSGLNSFLFEENEPEIISMNNQVLPLPLSQQQSLRRRIIKAIRSPPKTLIQLSSYYFKRAPTHVKKIKKRGASVIVHPEPSLFHRRCNSHAPSKHSYSSLLMAETNGSAIDIDKCLTCLEQSANAVLMECGHGGVCFECALRLESSSGLCHICRSPITQVLKVMKIPGGALEVISEDC